MPSLSVRHAIGFDRMRARERGGAEQAAAEARAFFVGPIDQADRDRRAAVVLAREAAQDFEAGQHAEAAIEPAAVRDGIEMAADEQRLVAIRPAA